MGLSLVPNFIAPRGSPNVWDGSASRIHRLREVDAATDAGRGRERGHSHIGGRGIRGSGRKVVGCKGAVNESGVLSGLNIDEN